MDDRVVFVAAVVETIEPDLIGEIGVGQGKQREQDAYEKDGQPSAHAHVGRLLVNARR
jgi:hypothetical protein